MLDAVVVEYCPVLALERSDAFVIGERVADCVARDGGDAQPVHQEVLAATQLVAAVEEPARASERVSATCKRGRRGRRR